MTDRIRKLPEPAGFGRCKVCAYLETGTPDICYACAHQSFEGLPSTACPVCSHPLTPPDECRNIVCHYPDRYFEKCHAISMRSGVLETAINRYKYEGRCGWALIFGRVLAGYLIAHRAIFSNFDMIVGSPTFVSPGGRREWDHIRGILEKASDQFDPEEWPMDLNNPPAIIQTAETPRFAGLNWQQRRGIATGVLRSSLFVPEPTKTRNRKILVFDDVFTEGLRMNEVARALKEQGGAGAVSGLVLARQQYRGHNR